MVSAGDTFQVRKRLYSNDKYGTFVMMRASLRYKSILLFLLMQRENQLTLRAVCTNRNRRETPKLSDALIMTKVPCCLLSVVA